MYLIYLKKNLKFLNYKSHFKNGTFNIKEPGRYVLMEDIIFEPNRNNNFMPFRNDDAYILLCIL